MTEVPSRKPGDQPATHDEEQTTWSHLLAVFGRDPDTPMPVGEQDDSLKEHIGGCIKGIREEMAGSDSLLSDFTDQRRAIAAGDDGVVYDEEQQAQLESEVGLAAYYIHEINGSETASITDSIDNALEELERYKPNSRIVIETAVRDGVADLDDVKLIDTAVFLTRLKMDLGDAASEGALAIGRILYVRGVMRDMQDAVADWARPALLIDEGKSSDTPTTELAVSGESVLASDIAAHLKQIAANLTTDSANEDAQWICDKYIERGWFTIAHDLHEQYMAAQSDAEQRRFELARDAFFNNIDSEEMRAKYSSVLFAVDAHDRLWHGGPQGS